MILLRLLFSRLFPGAYLHFQRKYAAYT